MLYCSMEIMRKRASLLACRVTDRKGACLVLCAGAPVGGLIASVCDRVPECGIVLLHVDLEAHAALSALRRSLDHLLPHRQVLLY